MVLIIRGLQYPQGVMQMIPPPRNPGVASNVPLLAMHNLPVARLWGGLWGSVDWEWEHFVGLLWLWVVVAE